MKLFKQDYISFDGSGSFAAVSGDARENVVDDADVAYRLSRIAEEERERMTADDTAPNAVDAADMSAYTGIASQHAQAPLSAQSGESAAFASAPVALVVARGKAAKRAPFFEHERALAAEGRVCEQQFVQFTGVERRIPRRRAHGIPQTQNLRRVRALIQTKFHKTLRISQKGCCVSQ